MSIQEGYDCLTLDGVNDYINLGTTMALKTQTQTMECWLKLNAIPTDTNTGGTIFVSYENLKGVFYTVLYTGMVHIRIHDGTTNYTLNSNTVLVVGQYYHIACVVDYVAKTLSIYINGIFDSSAPFTAYLIPDPMIGSYIGSWVNAGTVYSNLQGAINDVRIWNVARTQAQIQASMNIQLTGNEAGLVGYWKLNEGSGTTAFDSTPNALNGSLINGPIWSYSYNTFRLMSDGLMKLKTISDAPDCLSFDGINDYVDLYVIPPLSVFSFEWWINLDVIGITHGILTNHVSNSTHPNYMHFINADNKLHFRFTTAGTGAFQGVISSTVFTTNRWYHIAGTYDGTTLKLYIDGILDNSVPATGIPWTINVKSVLGIDSRPEGMYTNYLKGKLHDFRIWNVARTQADIQANMYIELFGNEAGLISYWKLNEGGGTTSYDSTTNANNGLTNGPIWDYSYSNFRLTKDGILKVKNIQEGPDCLTFDGINDYIDIGSSPILKPTALITVEAWVKINADSGDTRFLSDWHQSQYTDRWLFYIASGYIRWVVCNANEITFTDIPYAYTLNQWMHIAGVYDGTNSYLYINGVRIGSGFPMTGAMNAGIGATIRFGNQQEVGGFFNGSLNEVHIWNVARTQAEIQANMNKQLSGNETGLVGYWKLNEGSGLTAYDATANANNGTLTNGPTWAYSYTGIYELTTDGRLKVRGGV